MRDSGKYLKEEFQRFKSFKIICPYPGLDRTLRFCFISSRNFSVPRSGSPRIACNHFWIGFLVFVLFIQCPSRNLPIWAGQGMKRCPDCGPIGLGRTSICAGSVFGKPDPGPVGPRVSTSIWFCRSGPRKSFYKGSCEKNRKFEI